MRLRASTTTAIDVPGDAAALRTPWCLVVARAATGAAAGLRDVLVAGTDKDLTALAGELAELCALAGAGIAAITAEAETRGLVAASQFASTAGWVATSPGTAAGKRPLSPRPPR